MQKKTVMAGILCLCCATVLVSCKPADGQDEASSDAFTASMAAEVRPIDSLKVSAKLADGSAVALTWSKVSRAASYTVLRSENGGTDWETLKKLSSSKTSFQDDTAQLGTDYYYKIQAACEYSRTDLFAYSANEMPDTVEAECEIYTGVGGAFWNDAVTKNKQETLGTTMLQYSFGANGKESAEPEGVEIYRGTSENDLKVLKRGIVKDVSCADYDFGKAYADTDVKQGKSYYYKVRAYAMMNGKEVYGDWSPVIRIRAAEPDGVYTMRLVREPDSYRNNVIVALTSADNKNGVLTLSAGVLSGKLTMKYLVTQDYFTQQSLAKSSGKPKKKPSVQQMKLRVDRYSTDGRYYSAVTGDIVLKAQQTVYLELAPTVSTDKLLPFTDLDRAKVTFNVKYNEGSHPLMLDLKKSKALLENPAQ